MEENSQIRRDRGIGRVVFELPSARADEVLPILDRCAKLVQSAMQGAIRFAIAPYALPP